MDILQTRLRLALWHHWLQAFLTWLSGIAPPGARPRRPWTARDHAIAQFATVVVAGSVGIAAAQHLLNQVLFDIKLF